MHHGAWYVVRVTKSKAQRHRIRNSRARTTGTAHAAQGRVKRSIAMLSSPGARSAASEACAAARREEPRTPRCDLREERSGTYQVASLIQLLYNLGIPMTSLATRQMSKQHLQIGSSRRIIDPASKSIVCSIVGGTTAAIPAM